MTEMLELWRIYNLDYSFQEKNSEMARRLKPESLGSYFTRPDSWLVVYLSIVTIQTYFLQ